MKVPGRILVYDLLASSYGHFIAAFKFRYQCRILLFVTCTYIYIYKVVSRLKKVEPPLPGHHPKSKPIKKMPARCHRHFCLVAPFQRIPGFYLLLNRLTLDVILIGFGDMLTARCLPSSKSLNFDEDVYQNRNAKMLPARGCPGRSAWASVQDWRLTRFSGILIF